MIYLIWWDGYLYPKYIQTGYNLHKCLPQCPTYNPRPLLEQISSYLGYAKVLQNKLAKTYLFSLPIHPIYIACSKNFSGLYAFKEKKKINSPWHSRHSYIWLSTKISHFTHTNISSQRQWGSTGFVDLDPVHLNIVNIITIKQVTQIFLVSQCI